MRLPPSAFAAHRPSRAVRELVALLVALPTTLPPVGACADGPISPVMMVCGLFARVDVRVSRSDRGVARSHADRALLLLAQSGNAASASGCSRLSSEAVVSTSTIDAFP